MVPLVSIIIPGFNHAIYLKERIDSVLAQDYPCFEVILLDDCSSDNSTEIMQRYADEFAAGNITTNAKSVVFYPNDKNSGNTFLQWKKGIKLAKGEYIWIAESDDVAKPSLLSECMTRLLANSNAVAAFTWSNMIDPDGKDLGYSWDETKRYKAPGIYDGKTFCMQRLVYKNLMYNASMIVFTKDAYYNINKVYQQYRHSGDWLFWFYVCMQGKVCEVPLKLNSFRQHPNKVSNDSRTSGDDFREMGAIQTIIAEEMKLSKYQRACLRGRQAKRLQKSQLPDTRELVSQYPDIYQGSFFDKLLYTIDKSLNISGLNR